MRSGLVMFLFTGEAVSAKFVSYWQTDGTYPSYLVSCNYDARVKFNPLSTDW